MPDLPIIMIAEEVDRFRALEAARIGVRDVILKPMSPKTLQDRIIGILSKPRHDAFMH